MGQEQGQATKRHCIFFAKGAKKMQCRFAGQAEGLKGIKAEKAIIFICNKEMSKILERGRRQYNAWANGGIVGQEQPNKSMSRQDKPRMLGIGESL